MSHDPEILLGMARGPWACLWGDAEEEAGARLSGVDLYAEAPEAPEWAEEWAKKLAAAIVMLNSASLEEIYRAARQEGFAKDREAFGYYLGLQATGAGVRWNNDLSGSDLKIKIPTTEFYDGVREVDTRFVSE